jgi:Ca-activated chloride channel homolog
MNDELKTQLTAWALDELPAEERASIEERLEAQPEEKAYAEETREFCLLLERTLAPEAETTLTVGQREELARQFRTVAPAGKAVRLRSAAIVWVAGLGAVAAALVIWSGRFASPPGGTVAMDRLNEAPESDSKKLAAAADSGVITDFDATSPADESKTEGARRLRMLVEEERVGVAQALPLAKDAPTDPASRSIEPAASFGLDPKRPSSAAPVDALAAAATVDDKTSASLGLEVKPEVAKNTTWNAPLRPEGLTEEFFQRPAAEPQVLAEPQAFGGLPAVAEASRPTGPAAPATAPAPEEVRLKLKDAPDGTDASGASLLADLEKPGEAKLSRGRSGAGATASTVTEPGGAPQPEDTSRLSVAGNKPSSQRFGRGAMDGASPPPTTSLGTFAERGGVAGGGGVPEERAAGFYAKETVPSKTPPEPSVHYRYFATTPAQPGTESYAALPENPFKAVATEPLSTFSIDVDTAGYANVRRFLNQGQRPPQDAVRIEEMVNYFRYDYPQPEAGKPFSVTVDVADCPWQPQHRLARVGLKGREVAPEKRPNSNLVFLIDVSGSMDEPNKLPLVQQSLRMLSSQLTEKDRVAMVTYAGNSGIALDSTNGADRAKISAAIDQLTPGGSTNGASGIQLAYQVAQQHFIKEGVNRVLLATDGDFNVGVTSQEELQKLITERARSGVFLSVLGYGMGNLKDSTMEMLADKGNGNYAYIDSLGEARKVLSEEMSGTLVTIAKDVKIQIEFNPQKVGAYRLIGYEKRMLKAEDFKDDKKDAGEIGAGHTITALYELVPPGKSSPAVKTDPLVFQKPAAPAKVSPELEGAVCLVKLRYKQPDGDKSTEVSFPGKDEGKKYTQTSDDFRFAAAAASFAMILRDSQYKGNATPASVLELAQAAKGPDPGGYRAEFIKLVEKVKELKK